MYEKTKAHEFQMSLNEHPHRIQNLSLDGKCSKCGKCCSDILPLTSQDMARMRMFIQTNKFKPFTQRTEETKDYYDNSCPFMTDDFKCAIYTIRPEVCKYFGCWKPQLSPEVALDELSEEDQKTLLMFYAKSPKGISMRKELFGEECPF